MKMNRTVLIVIGAVAAVIIAVLVMQAKERAVPVDSPSTVLPPVAPASRLAPTVPGTPSAPASLTQDPGAPVPDADDLPSGAAQPAEPVNEGAISSIPATEGEEAPAEKSGE